MSLALFVVAGFLAFVPVARADYFKLDAGHSAVIFRVKHLGLNHFYGRFNEVDGTLEFDEKDPKKAKVEVTLKTASVDTNSKGRDKHIQGAGALAAEEHPIITFKSTAISPSGKDQFKVLGDLTFRGMTKPITATAKKLGASSDGKGGGKIGFEVTLSFKRSEFGMAGMDMVSDEVELMAGLEWNRTPPPKPADVE